MNNISLFFGKYYVKRNSAWEKFQMQIKFRMRKWFLLSILCKVPMLWTLQKHSVASKFSRKHRKSSDEVEFAIYFDYFWFDDLDAGNVESLTVFSVMMTEIDSNVRISIYSLFSFKISIIQIEEFIGKLVKKKKSTVLNRFN